MYVSWTACNKVVEWSCKKILTAEGKKQNHKKIGKRLWNHTVTYLFPTWTKAFFLVGTKMSHILVALQAATFMLHNAP